MKPVIIIAIAVFCSVVAVFGVLFIDGMIKEQTIQEQEANEQGSTIFSKWAIVIALSSIVIAFFGFLLSLKKSKMEKLTHESQFVGNIHDKISRIERKKPSLQTQDDCIDYAIEFLNVISELCFFDQKKYLSKDIMGFFGNYMEASLALYDWLIETKYLNKKDLKKHYIEIIETCEKHNIVNDHILSDVFLKYLPKK